MGWDGKRANQTRQMEYELDSQVKHGRAAGRVQNMKKQMRSKREKRREEPEPKAAQLCPAPAIASLAPRVASLGKHSPVWRKAAPSAPTSHARMGWGWGLARLAAQQTPADSCLLSDKLAESVRGTGDRRFDARPLQTTGGLGCI
ncbi:hypothetical protein FB645_004910 [Coemansia sp. IMI 203386]|nr:hypothetical protein FB645_004910 [Coemansia sp. IMI 203386]